MSNSCVIQYVIFPPHQKVLAKNGLLNDESAESDTLNELEGDLQMVMEIWVEPQIGTMDIPDCALSYIHGAKYHEIPQKVRKQSRGYQKFVIILTIFFIFFIVCYCQYNL